MATKPARSVKKAVQVLLPAGGSDIPFPPDGMALAHWIGLRTRTLWWLVLNRARLYKTHKIPKPKGGVRILHEPNDKLKFAQRMLLDRILSKFPPHAHIGAYIDARGVRYTASRHAGQAVILELDIKDFFGSTTRKYVRDFFRGLGWPSETTKLAADLLTYPVRPDFSVVPQGAPTSPTICNLVANARFDQKIIEYLKTVHPDWLYTRYSDNIIVSHPLERSADEIRQVMQALRGAINAAGYRVHYKKTKVMRNKHPKRPQHLLGLTVNQVPNVPVQAYRKMRAQVHRATQAGFAAVTGLPKGARPASYLEGRLNYFLHINPDSPKLLRLKEQLNAIKQRGFVVVGAVHEPNTADDSEVA